MMWMRVRVCVRAYSSTRLGDGGMNAVVAVGVEAHLGGRFSAMRVLLQLGQKNLSQFASPIDVRGMRLSNSPQGLHAIGNSKKHTNRGY